MQCFTLRVAHHDLSLTGRRASVSGGKPLHNSITVDGTRLGVLFEASKIRSLAVTSRVNEFHILSRHLASVPLGG